MFLVHLLFIASFQGRQSTLNIRSHFPLCGPMCRSAWVLKCKGQIAEDRGPMRVGQGATNQLVVYGAVLHPTVDFSAFSILMMASAADILILSRGDVV